MFQCHITVNDSHLPGDTNCWITAIVAPPVLGTLREALPQQGALYVGATQIHNLSERKNCMCRGANYSMDSLAVRLEVVCDRTRVQALIAVIRAATQAQANSRTVTSAQPTDSESPISATC